MICIGTIHKPAEILLLRCIVYYSGVSVPLQRIGLRTEQLIRTHCATRGMEYHQKGTLYSWGIPPMEQLNSCERCMYIEFCESVGQMRQVLCEIQLTNTSELCLQSASVNIPLDSSRVNLNFALTQEPYILTTNVSVNQTTLGYDSPRLQKYEWCIVSICYTKQYDHDYRFESGSELLLLFLWLGSWRTGTYMYQRPCSCCCRYLNGIDEAGLQSGISIYPNPASSIVNVNLDAASTVYLSIYDASVRLIRQVRFDAMSNQLNVQDLAAGVYQIKINKGENTYNYKLVCTLIIPEFYLLNGLLWKGSPFFYNNFENEAIKYFLSLWYLVRIFSTMNWKINWSFSLLFILDQNGYFIKWIITNKRRFN